MISVLWKRRRSIVYFLHSARTTAPALILPPFYPNSPATTLIQLTKKKVNTDFFVAGRFFFPYKEKHRAAGAKKYSLHAFLMAKPFKIINYFCAWDAEIVDTILDVIARRRRKILRKWGWKCDFQRGNCIKIVDFFRRLRRANYRITIKYEQLRSIIPRPALNPPPC